MSEYMRSLRSSSRSPSASDNQLGIAEDRAASRNSNHSGPSLHNNASSRNESNRSSAKGDRMNSERKRNGDMSDSSYGHSDSSKFSQHSKLHRESPLIPPDISSDNEGMYDSPILVSENNENAMEGHIKPVAVKVLPPKVPHDTLNSVEKFNNQQENSHPKRTGIPAIDLAALRADLSVQTIDSSCTEEIVDNETPTDPNSKTNDDHPTVIDPISKLVDSSRSKTHSDNKHRYSKYIQEKELEESKRKHHHPMTREQHVISSSETQEDTASEKVTKNNQKLKQILHTDSAASSDTEDVRKALADKVRQTSLYRRKSSGELFRSLSTESNIDYESYLHEVEVKSPRSDFSNKDEDPLEESYKSLQSTSSIWKSAQPPKGEIIGVYQPALQESSGKDTPEEEHRLLELQSKKRKTTRESFMNDTLESKLQQPLSPNSSHGPRQSMQPSQSQQSLASSDPTEQSERNGLSLTPPGLSLDSPVKQHEKSYSDSATNGSKVVDTLSKNNNSENDQEHQNYLPRSTASTPSAIKKRLIRTISVGSPSDSDGGEGRSLRTESYTDDNFLQEALISTENSIPTQSSGKPLYSPSPIIEETGIRSATTTPDIVVVPHPVNSAINAVIPAASSTLNVDTGHGVITNNVTTQNSGKAGSNARRTSMVGVSVDTAKFLGNNGNNVPTDAYLVILNLKEKLQRLEAVDRARTKEINEIKNDEKVWEKNWMTEIMALRIRNDDLEIENKKLKETLVKMKIDMSNVNAKLAATENAKKSAEMMVDGCYARANREALSTILAQKKLIESLESSVNELKTQANTNQIELLSLNSLYSKTAEELLHWKSVAVQAVSTNKLHREGNNSNALNSSTKNDQESLNEHQNSAHSVSVMHAEVFASSELPATKKDNTNGEGEEPLQSFYTSNINRSSIDKESIANSEAIIHVVAKTPDWSFSPEKKEEFGEERAKFTVSTYKAAANNEVQQYIANIPNATVQATFEKLLSPIENDNNASSASNRSLAHDISSRGSIDYTFERSNTSHHPVDLYEKHNAAYMLRKSPTQLSGHKENRENAQNVADIKPIENIVEVSTVAVPNAEEEDVDQRHNSKYRKYSEELLAKYFPSKNHARSPLSFGDNVSALNYAGGEINALAGSEYGVQGKSRANGLGLNNRMSTGSASDLYRHYNKPLSSFSATRRVTASSFDFSTRSKLRENLPRNSYVNNLPVDRDRLGKDYTGECVSSANRDPNAWYNKKFE